jgi:hypothetical protein
MKFEGIARDSDNEIDAGHAVGAYQIVWFENVLAVRKAYH